MSKVQRVVATKARRVFAAALLLLSVVATVPLLEGVASAHHPEISASASCAGTITYTSTAWEGNDDNPQTPQNENHLSRSNSDIQIDLLTGQGFGTVSATQHGVYTVANGFQFSGSFTWPNGVNSVRVRASAVGNWGNGSGGGDLRTTATINKPTNCGTTPAVTNAVSCQNQAPGAGDGQVVLSFTNVGGPFGASVTFAVAAFNGQGSFNQAVAVGETKTKTYTLVPDGTYTIVITIGGTHYDQTFVVDCDTPAPAVSNNVVCEAGNGKVTITLTNAGGEGVTFVVTNPGNNTTENVVVGAGSSTTRSFSGFADGTHTVVVTVGATHYDQTFVVDCDHPQPGAGSVASCDTASHDGKVVVTLTNTGTEAVVFQVTNPLTNTVEDITVVAGGSATRTFSGFNDGPHTVVITADGQHYDQTFMTTCDVAPDFSYDQSCVSGDGKVVITLVNDGDDTSATFVVQNIVHVVPANSSEQVTIGSLADGQHTIQLSINGADKSFSITVDCDRPGEPGAEVAKSCVDEDGTVVVTLTNSGGQLPLTFVVDGTNHVVAANSTKNVTISGLSDGSHTITITQGQHDYSTTVSIDCDQAPTVDHTQQCVDGSNGHSDGKVVVSLHNNGDDSSVTFTVNGTDHVVGPKASKDVTVSGLSDGSHTITVTAGQQSFSFDVDVDCDQAGEGSVTKDLSCVDGDGSVVLHLTATGGELPVTFKVGDNTYQVQPDTTTDVTLGGFVDGTHSITVVVGGQETVLSITVDCDAAPKASFTAECAGFDGAVSVLLENPGDDLSVVFEVGGVEHTVAPGATKTVVIGDLVDGDATISLSIDGEEQPDITATFDCDPTFEAEAECNTLSVDGEIETYWYTITNTESEPVSVAWDGGTTTVAAGGTATIGSNTSPLALTYDGVEIVSAPGAQGACTRNVTFTKELIGQPPTGETYTVLVSRLVGSDYQEEVTFDLNAGQPVTITLPSTLDPDGIQYTIEEIDAGTAVTSTISPDELKLSGNLGETISVIVTNGYAAVQIDKQSLTTNVVAGGEIVYTLRAINTGGLTLDPVVISDRLPGQVEFVSVSVQDGAGLCALAENARPQLVVCTMDDALPAAGVTKLITLTVKVDTSVSSGTTILNQAKVLGTYQQADAGKAAGTERRVEALDTDLSCLPAVAGTVCDLSAKIGVPVSEVGQESPTTTTTTIVRGSLPRTGGSNPMSLLAIAFGLACLGASMLFTRRRFVR